MDPEVACSEWVKRCRLSLRGWSANVRRIGRTDEPGHAKLLVVPVGGDNEIASTSYLRMANVLLTGYGGGELR